MVYEVGEKCRRRLPQQRMQAYFFKISRRQLVLMAVSQCVQHNMVQSTNTPWWVRYYPIYRKSSSRARIAPRGDWQLHSPTRFQTIFRPTRARKISAAWKHSTCWVITSRQHQSLTDLVQWWLVVQAVRSTSITHKPRNWSIRHLYAITYLWNLIFASLIRAAIVKSYKILAFLVLRMEITRRAVYFRSTQRAREDRLLRWMVRSTGNKYLLSIKHILAIFHSMRARGSDMDQVVCQHH